MTWFVIERKCFFPLLFEGPYVLACLAVELGVNPTVSVNTFTLERMRIF